jgi:cell wall-associated NlpC family hydrolase
VASAVAPPTTPKTTTSVDPLYAAALAQAKASLAAETAPIKGEQAASDAAFKQQETDSTGAAAAVSKLLAPIGPAVNGEFQTAAQNQELAANGFSHGMQDALQGNTDNLNAMLQKLGSPATLDSHASEAADSVYARGGYNPGVAFSKQGAAFGVAADLQSGDALLKGQQDVSSLKAKAIVADQGFQAKIAEMAGKLPGDVQTNYQHLQTLALDNAKFREQVAKDKSDAAFKLADAKLAQLKYSTSVQEFNAKQQLAYAKLSNQQFNQNRDYALKLQNLGIAQTKLQLAITKASVAAANGGLTPAALGKYTSQAQAIAMKSYYGYTKVTSKSGVPTATPNVGNVTYAEALQNILQKGVPVQVALDALDRVYPKEQRPSDAILAQVLGPLDPAALKAVAVANFKQYQTNVGLAAAANWTADPTSQLTHGESTVVKAAQSMLGTPYVWGGNTPGKALDCSGFICQAYAQLGISLPRTTQQMVHAGTGVALNQLQPGDLVFTEPGKTGPAHVGMYVGNGQIQESPHTGDVNKYIPLKSFLGGGFVAARRILP